MRHTLARTFLTMAVVTAACGGSTREAATDTPPAATAPPAWPVTVSAVASPAATGSSEPQLTVSDKGVLLSWIEMSGPRAALKFAERDASGWSGVKTVASGDDWFVSYADVPTVLRLSNGTLVANWLQNTEPQIEAYDLRLTYSRDDGKTWARGFLPHHDGTKTQHGFASLFELPTKGVGLVWLDGRAAELDTTSPEGGAMSLRYAAFDANWKQTADTSVDARVCECCPTTAGVTPDGIITAFRDRSDREIRDIHVSRLENGTWTASAPVHADNWEIAACPVNGPRLKVRDRTVAVAWFTVKNDQGQAYAAFSSDAGRSWGMPIRLDEQGSLGRVDVELLEDGFAVATWLEFANQRAQFQMRRIEPSGSKSAAVTIAGMSESRASGYPRIARHGNELVFAWTAMTASGNESEPAMKVETAVARIP